MNMSYKESVNQYEWDLICTFLAPWLQHPETNESIETYYNYHKKYYEALGLTLIINLPTVLGVMMFMSLEQIVIYPQDEWECIEFYFNDEQEPEGYNIIPKIIV